MKNMFRFYKIFILLLAVSTAAFSQYTGTNPNVAQGKVAFASDSIDGSSPMNAVDGSMASLASIPGGGGAWIQIDLGIPHMIDGYGMAIPNALELPSTFKVQVSDDASSWTDLATQSVGQDSTFSANLVSPEYVKFVRILMTAADDPATFAQIMVFGEEMPKPDQPTATAATNITTTGFTANWDLEPDALGYVISVATDVDFNNIIPDYDKWGDNITDWDVVDLDPGTEYFYRIRAYNPAGTSTFGNIISVTTEKEAQTITFDALPASTYGDMDFDLTATATSGLDVAYASSDESVATIMGITVSIVGPGTASITATQDGNDMYLAADPLMQDLVVNVKALTVANAMAENKVYDGNDQALVSGATLEGVVGDDVVTLAGANTGIFAQVNTGTGIAVSTSMTLAGADMDKYSLTASTDLTADITAADLTATADDKNREACAANPDFTLSYSGFVGSDNESVITEQAMATCAADSDSPAGAYDITVSGGSAPNYAMVYVTGTLTISPDVTPPSLEVQNITVQLDASNNGVITTDDVLVSSDDNCGVTETTLSQYVFTDADVGDVNVNVTASDAAGNETTQVSVVTVIGYVGIEDVKGLNVKVYPNPTYGSVTLELSDYADELKVMDITGKTLFSIASPDRQESIDFSDHHSGIYVIQLKYGNKVFYHKVVKK